MDPYIATPITIVVMQDDPGYREGLQAMIAHDARFELLPEDTPVGPGVIERLQPDAILVDPSSERRIDYTSLTELRQAAPSSAIAVFTRVAELDAVAGVLNMGTLVYSRKGRDADLHSLLNAVAFAVQEQGRWAVIDARLAAQFQALLSEPPGAPEPGAPPPHLTEMELKVLALLVQDMTEKQIAKELFLARPTVDYHLRELRRKLKAHSLRRLCYLAGKYGLV